MSARIGSIPAPGGFAALLKRRIWGEASWALIGQVGSGLVLLLGTRLITELVAPEIYGQVALMNGLIALGVSIFAYPFVSAGMRLLPEALQQGRRLELSRVLAMLTRRSTALALLLLTLGGGAYCYFKNHDPRLFAAAGVLLVATVQRELGVQLLIAERRQRAASLWQTGDSMLRPVCAIALLYLGGPNGALILSGYALASLAISALQRLVRRADPDAKAGPRHASVGELKRDVLTYAWPLIPMELLSWFNSLGDRYVIGYLMSAADVGVYAAAYTLTNEAFQRSAMVLLRTFQPVYFGHFAAHRRERALQVFGLWLACVLALGLGGVTTLLFLKDRVAALLLAEVYRDAAVLMPVIGAGCALQALAKVMAQPLYASKRTRALLAGRILGALTAAIAIPLMVRWQGLMGAAMAAPIYSGTEVLVLTLIARPWRAGTRRGEPT